MKKTQRILAIIGVILLIGCYVTTLIAALFKTEFAMSLFKASLFCSAAVPIVIYGYILIYKVFHKED